MGTQETEPIEVVLVNPNLVVQKSDLFTTGVVYMPLSLAYLASSLRQAGFPVRVLDAFGQRPRQARREGKFLVFGLPYAETVGQIPMGTKLIFIGAQTLINHLATVAIIRRVKDTYPNLPVVVLENSQAVTAYALRDVAAEFYRAGANYILTGESDYQALRFVQLFFHNSAPAALRQLAGLGSPEFYNPPMDHKGKLEMIPFPAWDLFPLENYWSVRFAHGPQTADRYLPLLTSRGCPYRCRFCVIPAMNHQRWRGRSAENVVDEMEYSARKYGVREFHLEDPNPTISDRRMREICHEILRRGLKVIWKIAAGTKIETIRNAETLEWMAKAGCRYISISPETGSSRLLQKMQKPFNLEHMRHLVRQMNRLGIHSQACFVLGFPEETKEDWWQTRELIRDLTCIGIDEIALFIITPVPGSAICDRLQGFQELSELNFSPAWRSDYPALQSFRLRLYGSFLWWKLKTHPLRLLRQPFNFLRRRFATKMEMVPYRAMRFLWLGRKAK